MSKYFKPKSLSWWSGFVPIAGGVFIAFEPVHQLTDISRSLHTAFGSVPPAVLINGGLAVIGLRGAHA